MTSLLLCRPIKVSQEQIQNLTGGLISPGMLPGAAVEQTGYAKLAEALKESEARERKTARWTKIIAGMSVVATVMGLYISWYRVKEIAKEN